MLNTFYGTLDNVQKGQQSVGVGSVILRTSSDLAKCESLEIEAAIRQSILDVSAIVGADEGGWFLLADSGALADIFRSAPHSRPTCSHLKNGLHRLPWCLAQLNEGKAVLIYDTDDLFPAAEIDREFLKSAKIRSLALLPSNSIGLGRTVLVFSSSAAGTQWSHGLVEQCTLLEELFINAYQRRSTQSESNDAMDSFQQLLNASMNAMAILNRKGDFIASNKAFRDVFGYSEVELQGLKCNELGGALNHFVEASHLKYLSGHAIANYQREMPLTRKDKSLLSAKATVSRIGRPLAENSILLMAIEDLTGQKLREAELGRRQTEVGLLASLLIQSQENDRKVLSRELHDDIGQRLSLAASEAALLASQRLSTASISAERLEGLRDELDSLCTDVHEMSHDLHSYKLQHLGLAPALKDLCRRLSQPDFHVHLHADGLDEPASKDVSLCLYRVAQESLNNALKHASTPVVAVTIAKLQDMFYMTIQDSGIGFDSSKSSHGLGLVSISERIRLVNGKFRMHSVPGRGTEIWVAVPDQMESIAGRSHRTKVA
jgi:PAS domain S-box-containing protein